MVLIKKDIYRLIASGGILTGLIIVLSIPLGSLPILGDIIGPNNGVWALRHTEAETLEIDLPNLQGEVTVIRDPYGVPHVYAEYEKDAIQVMGYLHAKDRLIQLELTKRQASGTLSEVIGPDVVETDKFFRNIQLRKSAESLAKYVKESEPENYELIEAYVEGLNYYITNVEQYTFEFILLGIEPSLWDPVDVLSLQGYMSYMLTYS